MTGGPARSEPTRLTVDGREVAPLEIAGSRRAISRGLLGRDSLDGALWLQPCRQVHTFRMRFTLDVAHLDAHGHVRLVRRLAPGRLGPVSLRCRVVLEAQAGSFERWGLGVGSAVGWREPT